MKSVDLRIRVLLVLQSSLVGMISENMSAVLVSWNDSLIKIRVLFDSPLAADDADLCSMIESEVISHFDDKEVICTHEYLNKNSNIKVKDGEVYVFKRK